METIRLNLLGTPSLARAGRPVQLQRAKGLALLLYLALTRVAQPRERVVDLLWPESLPQAGRKNMRNTLWAIREAVGGEVLDLDGATLRLAESVIVDVHALEDGLLLLESGQVADLERAAARYGGPLGDGLAVQDAPEFEVWLTIERERVAAIYLRLLDRIVALHRAAGNWQRLIDYARRVLAVDPLREPTHLALIEAHVALGQRAQAGQQYAALLEILRRELDVAPLPETAARYEALLSGAAAGAVPRARHAVPALDAPFVGRDAELAALDAELARAMRGEPRVVLIGGELGIGKSRLWRAWAARLPTEAVLLTTHVLETSEPVPFAPLLMLFREGSPARAIITPPSPLALIWLTELARLLPEIAASWPGLPLPLALSPPEERARLFQALAEALRPLARRPLVVAIDDLHWADPSTLDALVYLVDHLRDAPLLLIGTYRGEETAPQLAAIVAAWQRQGRLHQIALRQLTPDEGHALLDGLRVASDAGARAHWIWQSGGNPYFLLELSRAGSDSPPGDLAALVRARVRARVPAGAYQVLQAAAVLGDEATIATLRITSGRSEEELLDALDALMEANLLVEQGSVYGFVHPLVSAVVAQDLSEARRIFLHRRAARALEQAGPPQRERLVPALAAHYSAAADAQRAAHYAELAAARALAVGAFVEAAVYARHALGWEPTPRRLLLLGDALAVAGAADEAQQQLAAALEGFEQADDPVGATEAIVTLARTAIATGRPDAARGWLDRTPIERAQRIRPALGVEVHLLAAGVHRHRRAFEAAEVELDRADRLVREHHLTEQASRSAFERGNLLANMGRLREALAAFAESLRQARACVAPAHEALTLNNLAFHALLAGDIDAAQQYLEQGTALAERMGLTLLPQYLFSTAGEIALAQGRLGAADAAFVRSAEVARRWGNAPQVANALVGRALVARASGELASARVLLAEAQALLADNVDPALRDKLARARSWLRS